MTNPSGDGTGDGGTPSLFQFTTTRPVAVLMMVAAAVTFGLVGFNRLPVNLLPDIAYPTVTIRTQYPGASPEDVEERVSERIQESVSVVPGVRRVVSISRAEVSDVLLEFVWGTEMVFAISDIRERLDRVLLPREAERPLVLRYDPSLDPVVTLGLSGDIDPIELRRIAEEDVERELAKLEGVAAVKVRGGDEEEIRITLDEQALSVLRLDVDLVGQRLAAENVNTASGSIDEGNTEFLVRTLGEFRNLQEIEELILEHRNDATIRLADVARVERIPQEKEVVSRVNGKPCVLVDVYKEAGANVVELAGGVRDRVFGTAAQQRFVAGLAGFDAETERLAVREGAEGLDKDERDRLRAKRSGRQLERRRNTNWIAHELEPFGAAFDLLQDQSRFIRTSIDDVRDSAIKGGLFAVLVIFLFLRRLSATLVLAVSIPISLVASFAPMFLSDITLNIMSLGGLALGVGMLVDSSIVVLESIIRAREEGKDLATAAVVGTSRVSSAVVASTLTTVAVFFPIVFVEGVAGQLFRDQSLTVVYSLLVSLLVALFVIPMLASRGGPPSDRVREAELAARTRGRIQALAGGALRVAVVALGAVGVASGKIVQPLTWAFDRGYRAVEAAYRPLLAGALRARALVVLAALGLLVAAGYRAVELDREKIPRVAMGEVFVDVFLPRNATVERTDSVVAPLEQAIANLPNVAGTFLAVGVDPDELNDAEEGEHSARILVRLEPSNDPAALEERVRERIRTLIDAIPAIDDYRFEQPSVLSFNTPLVVEILGRDLYALRDASAAVEGALNTLPGLRDVRNSLQAGNPEIVLRLDREKMAALDLDSRVVTRILQSKVQGDVPTRFAERERKIDMRVAMAQDELGTVSRLLDVNVNPAGSPPIPLAAVAEVRRLEGPSEIRRIGNSRGAEVRANVQGFGLASMQPRVAAALDDVPRPDGIDFRLGGQEELDSSLSSLQMALALAIFLVYIVMASQFESLVQPIVILASLPLAFVGVVFALDLLSINVSVIVLLGAIVLVGIVVNNAIILVDQVNRLRAEGRPKLEAIVEGSRTRLRPVLMTTTTTVLGLLPLTGWLQSVPILGGTEEGVELRAPMAIAVIAGLVTSTVLTLVVVPVVYSLSDRKA